MRSVLEKNTRDELIVRIGTLNSNSQRQWGKMSLVQMLKHCVRREQLYFGEIKVPRSFLGRLIGGPALRNMLKEGAQLSRNAPTSSRMKIADSENKGDIETEKQHWIGYIQRYAGLPHTGFTHWFFGRMTPEQIGQFVYKHADHHLRQFGA